jgi:hypothetical protein
LPKIGIFFDHGKAKMAYHVDSYFRELGSPTEDLIQNAIYWYSVWSHRRNGAWKGYVQVTLDPVNDAAAAALLTGPAAPGGAP